VVHFFRSGDDESMAQAMFDVINRQRNCEILLSCAVMSTCSATGWDQKKKRISGSNRFSFDETFADVQPFGLELAASEAAPDSVSMNSRIDQDEPY